MLKVTDLHKEFPSAGKTVKAVDGISFHVPAGTLAAIIGKSGSGKSTLLALLGALDEPTKGTIELADQDITKLHGRKLLQYRRSTVGFVFQNYNLVPNLTAIANVMLPMEFASVPGGERKKRAEHLLKQVGLTGDKLQRLPGRLSGGEQQRVAIARALANQPKLILADEPTGNLDTQTGQVIVDLLRSLAKSEQATIITVTHDQAMAKHADQVYRLQDGKIAKI